MGAKTPIKRIWLDKWIISNKEEELESRGLTPKGRRVLEELNQIYEYTGVLRKLVKTLEPEIRKIYDKEQRPVKILDIGMRDGTLLHLIGEFGVASRIPTELQGVEFRADLAAFAKEQCISRGDRIQVYHDAQKELKAFMPGSLDIVCSTFMLHHHTPEEVSSILRASFKLSRFSVYHLDLSRSLHGILALWIIYTLLGFRESRSDSVLSCRRAFRKKEIEDMIGQINESGGVQVRRAFPFYLVVERKQK